MTGADKPSAAQLGSSLKAFAAAAATLGQAHRWRPAPDSTTAQVWRRASQGDSLARTLAEDDWHAIVLIRSGLEHVTATGASISAGRAFLPHTLARTAAEHFLRANHALDPDASDAERARRRLNEWLYAIHESDLRNQGLVRAGQITYAEAGRDRRTMVAQVAERAQALGESLERTENPRRVPRVGGTEGREATMSLAERYTAGEAFGIPRFTTRWHASVAHGTEIGLLSCLANDGDRSEELGGVDIPVPAQQDAPELAFSCSGCCSPRSTVSRRSSNTSVGRRPARSITGLPPPGRRCSRRGVRPCRPATRTMRSAVPLVGGRQRTGATPPGTGR